MFGFEYVKYVILFILITKQSPVIHDAPEWSKCEAKMVIVWSK